MGHGLHMFKFVTVSLARAKALGHAPAVAGGWVAVDQGVSAAIEGVAGRNRLLARVPESWAEGQTIDQALARRIAASAGYRVD